jgi:hypothetical protein
MAASRSWKGTRFAMQKWRNEAAIDVVNLILGAFLFLSPWIFNFASSAVESRNAWILGIVIAIVAIAAIVSFAEWEEWLNLALGLWVLISPWVLGFSGASTAVRLHVVVGIIVAVLAAVELWLTHRAPPRVTA